MSEPAEEPIRLDNNGEDEQPPETGAPLWVLTFGDMMSLLLCFFVLMFSMSEIKVEKFLIAAESLRSGLGHGASRMMDGAGMGGQSVVDTDVLTTDPAPYDITIVMDDVDDFLELISKRLESFVGQHGLTGSVEIEHNNAGVSLSIQDVVLFDTGSSELRGESLAPMGDLGKIVAELDMPVVVAGHTDDRPINTRQFPSNWELSSARAATVTRIILQQGLDPSRVHVEGYGEFQPVASNDTPDGRARNRRVEILYTRQNVIDQMVERRKQEVEALKAQQDEAAAGATEPPPQ